MKDLDLNVHAPDEVPRVLRRASEAYFESAAELESAWNEKAAGRPWKKIARILELTANRIEEVVNE